MDFVDFKAEAKEFNQAYHDAFTRTLDSGWYILGREVEQFEQEFATYLNTPHVIGVANGLEAIQISLMALGIGKGDEVITTPLSAIATTLAILAVGAKPVFVDVKPDGQIDETLIASALTERSKAILPVHLYGNACQIDVIQELCTKHNLALIEDSCQAHGSSFAGRQLGTFGTFGNFSFYPTKNLGAIGDGGAIVTGSNDLALACRRLRDYGQAQKYHHVEYGLNSRLDELQAALLRAKLKHLNHHNQIRQDNADLYTQLLDPAKVEPIKPIKNSISNIHQFVIRSPRRDALQSHLANLGIPSLIHYPLTIPDQPLFSDSFAKLDLPVARAFAGETLSLPCGPYLTSKEIESIASAINQF